jgi:N-hydroxyarylamine O-acetyltransferase
MVAVTRPEARYALLNNRLTVRPVGGEAERRSLDADELQDALGGIFGLPVVSDWRPTLEWVVEAGG